MLGHQLHYKLKINKHVFGLIWEVLPYIWPGIGREVPFQAQQWSEWQPHVCDRNNRSLEWINFIRQRIPRPIIWKGTPSNMLCKFFFCVCVQNFWWILGRLRFKLSVRCKLRKLVNTLRVLASAWRLHAKHLPRIIIMIIITKTPAKSRILTLFQIQSNLLPRCLSWFATKFVVIPTSPPTSSWRPPVAHRQNTSLIKPSKLSGLHTSTLKPWLEVHWDVTKLDSA